MIRLTLAALTLTLALSGCDTLTPQESDLALARHRWERSAPQRYVYSVERLCFCAFRGPARVTVDSGQVVSVVPVPPQEEPPYEGWEEWFPSVEGLFDILEDAIAQDADSIAVTYDPATGVPVEFFIDYLRMAADEELGMRVTAPVQPLATP